MRKALLALLAVLTMGCASSQVPLHSRPSDLELVMEAASACTENVAERCSALRQTTPISIEIAGNGERTWLITSLIESALLASGFTLLESSVADDSLAQTLEIKVLDLGVHHRGVNRRGLGRTPWVLREGVCVIVSKGITPDGDVVFSGESIGKKADWTPASHLDRLSDPLFTPDLDSVPTSAGIIGPLAVVAAAGGLMALFFITSD